MIYAGSVARLGASFLVAAWCAEARSQVPILAVQAMNGAYDTSVGRTYAAIREYTSASDLESPMARNDLSRPSRSNPDA